MRRSPPSTLAHANFGLELGRQGCARPSPRRRVSFQASSALPGLGLCREHANYFTLVYAFSD